MFDISFAELMLIAVVALLVIGPDRLPKVARTLGAYTGRLQRYIAQVKDEVNRELNFEELQAMQQDLKSSVDEAKASIRDGVEQTKQAAEKVEHSIADVVKEDSAASSEAEKNPSTKKRAVKKSVTKKTSASKKVASKKKPVTKESVESAP